MIDDPVLLNDWHAVLPLDAARSGQQCDRRPSSGRGHRHLESRAKACAPGRIYASIAARGCRWARCWRTIRCNAPITAGPTTPTGSACASQRIPSRSRRPKRAFSLITRLWPMTSSGSVWVSRLMTSRPLKNGTTPAIARFSVALMNLKRPVRAWWRTFLDVAHFPFVHENILGTQERPEIPDYEVVTDDEWRHRLRYPHLPAESRWQSYSQLGDLHLQGASPAGGLFSQGSGREIRHSADGHAD